MSTPTDVVDMPFDEHTDPLDPSVPPTEPAPEDGDKKAHKHTADCGGGCADGVPVGELN
ncbi:hypothetical protein [Amycolatopsis samaneae]|uniref:FxLD family lantipeptide n=1 Tax=Amycolatopsis samaneae TaxID=664691 RepID=A0ABW5GTL0_9PSEU